MAVLTILQIFLYILLSFCHFSHSYRKDIFSTKTGYKYTFTEETANLENAYMSETFGERNCEAVNAQVFVRHGARHPGHKDIKKMTQLHKKLFSLDLNAYTFLRTWENAMSESMEKQLLTEGENEQYALGERFAKRLKGLFGDTVDYTNFISSSKERCIDSATAFYKGFTQLLFNKSLSSPELSTNDNILRYHEICKKFIEAVENNRTQMIHYINFKHGHEMKAVIKSVQTRLGIQHDELTEDDLTLIYFWCTFEMLHLGKEDWCQILTEQEMEVLEYHNDLKQYWKKAYGHPVIAEMACPLVSAMFTSMEAAIENQIHDQRGEVATFYFGHVESLAPLYAALGLFNDSEPLLETNYATMKSRKFKSSKILPFSANLALILYECVNPYPDASDVNDFILKLFVNEKPEKIPACDDYVCPFTEVKESYKHIIDHCLFEQVCKVDKDEL